MKTYILSLWYILVPVTQLDTVENFQWTKNNSGSFYYGTFPNGVLWGVGSSAYQTEGAWDKDGKGPSIWDAFTHKKMKVFRNETGDSACGGYYKDKDNIQLLKELKVNHYLFSHGLGLCPLELKANEKGMQFYDDTINSLLENNIIPIVSLYHWDLPQAVAVKGYDTREHAPGLKLGGCGAYKAEHYLIKVDNWYGEAMDSCSTTHQCLATDSLIARMEMVTKIVLPRVFTVCILISIVLLIFYLRNHS